VAFAPRPGALAAAVLIGLCSTGLVVSELRIAVREAVGLDALEERFQCMSGTEAFDGWAAALPSGQYLPWLGWRGWSAVACLLVTSTLLPWVFLERRRIPATWFRGGGILFLSLGGLCMAASSWEWAQALSVVLGSGWLPREGVDVLALNLRPGAIYARIGPVGLAIGAVGAIACAWSGLRTGAAVDAAVRGDGAGARGT
jgi:hypothetical protein